jgi:ABC-type antimicrobial peptide transport system permease subunit
MGVRIALGARPLDVLGLVVGRGARLALIGIATGTMAGLGLTRLLGGLVWGVNVTDARTFVAAPLLVLAAALVASWVPARRAARVDPMVALRSE